MRKKLLDEIELILSKTTLVNTCLLYYKQLIDIKANQPEQYSKGRNFFDSVSIGYDYVIICEIWKLYNKQEEKGSLYSILNFLKNNKSLFESEDECKEYISKMRQKIEIKDLKIIKTYRSKYFAHSDAIYFGKEKDLLIEYPFDLDYFDKLNKYAVKLLSEIYSKIANCFYIHNLNMVTGFDLNNFINDSNKRKDGKVLG